MKKKTENPFRTMYNRVYDYFTHNIVRRIFFITIVVVIISAIFIQIVGGHVFLFGILLLSAAIGSLMIMLDLIRKKRNFVAQLRDLEMDSLERIYEREGEEGVASLKAVFNKSEQKFMRRKKREYNFVIMAALIFAVILVVFFINML